MSQSRHGSNSRQSYQSFVAQQLSIQRQNLSSVCRLAVKSVLERVSYGTMDDGSSSELNNLFTIIEHLLNHRLKPMNTWYGLLEPRCFWEYIRVACKHIPNNCLANIEALEFPQSSYGKGRAWLRMCLMEKRLSDYVAIAIQQTKLARSYYDDGSFMLSDESSMLADVLLGLNSIDFSFDIKGVYLDYAIVPIIDFTPYLKFASGVDGYPEIRGGLVELSGSAGGDVAESLEHLVVKYEKQAEQFKTTCEQKSYLEEMLRIRESQITEAEVGRQRLIEAQRHVESDMRKEQIQYEAVILELQSQLSQLKEENQRHLSQIRLLTLQQQQQELQQLQLLQQHSHLLLTPSPTSSPIISMSELIELDRLQDTQETQVTSTLKVSSHQSENNKSLVEEPPAEETRVEGTDVINEKFNCDSNNQHFHSICQDPPASASHPVASSILLTNSTDNLSAVPEIAGNHSMDSADGKKEHMDSADGKKEHIPPSPGSQDLQNRDETIVSENSDVFYDESRNEEDRYSE